MEACVEFRCRKSHEKLEKPVSDQFHQTYDNILVGKNLI